MIALETALITWFNSSSGQTTNFPGGMWNSEVPEATQMPYLEITPIPGPTNTSYAQERDTVIVQIAGFGTARDTVGTAFESLIAALKAATISLSSGQLTDKRRLDAIRGDLMPPDGQGQDVWRWMCQIQFSITQ